MEWQGGVKPDYIENAYVSFCIGHENGTTRYRAKICCPGRLAFIVTG